MIETSHLMSYPISTPSLEAILECTQKLAFRGQESITRLKALNRLAHEAAQDFLQHLKEEEDLPKEEAPSAGLYCFILNQHSLNGLEILTGRNSEIGFEKIRNRLIENIRSFLKQGKETPVRQKLLVEV